MPLLRRKSVLAFAQETTAGTAETLDAGDAVFNVFDVDFQPNIEVLKRQGQGSLSKLPSVFGAYGGKVSYTVELAGSGGSSAPVPAWASVMLPCCGMKLTSTTFAPTSVTSDMKAGTIGFYVDGLYHVLYGAMGNFTIEADNGKPAKVRFEFEGCWTKPTDVALLAPTYPTVLPPRVVSSTLTIGSWTPTISKITISPNNVLKLREDITSTSGYRAAIVTDREFGGTLDPEVSLVATKDVWADWLASTEAAMALDIGSTTGNTIHIDGPKCQFVGAQNQEREGVVTLDLPYQLNRSGSTADSEFTINFA